MGLPQIITCTFFRTSLNKAISRTSELLSANKNNDEICEYIGAKSLKFLSLDGLYKAVGFDKRNETYPQLTDHYFTGDYPVKPIDELGDSKVTQLSLLSTASNN